MKKLVIWILALGCCTTLFAARGKTTPPGWYDDYEVALKKAKEQNRAIMVLFTGSDWCKGCIRLSKKVLDKSNFKSFAANHLILVYADNPKRTKLPPKLLEHNRRLRKFLETWTESNGGIPYTVIMSPGEEVLGSISGCPHNPDDYLKKVREFAKSPQPSAYYLKKMREIKEIAESRRREAPHDGTPMIIKRDPVGSIIFPRVVFNDTDVSSALQHLAKRSKGYDPENIGVEINLCITKRQPRKVTLDLTNARLDDILRNICVETELQCRRVKSRTFDIFDQ